MFNNTHPNVKFVMRRSKKYQDVPSNVEFLPFWTDTKEITSIVNDSYLVVVPSIWEDPSPLSAVKQCQWGSLSVGLDVMGTREQIKNGETGFLAKVGDINELYSKTKKLVDDEELASKMGMQGKEKDSAVILYKENI